MTSVQRGFLIIAVGSGLALLILASAGSALWRAGDASQQKAQRYEFLADHRAETLDDLEKWRNYAKSLQRGYVTAATAAQAEALLREDLSNKISEIGAELSSIESMPAERGDPDGLLRLRVVLTAPEHSLSGVFVGLSDNEPTVVIENAEVKLASGIRRPTTDGTLQTAKPLQLSLNVSAFWKEQGANG